MCSQWILTEDMMELNLAWHVSENLMLMAAIQNYKPLYSFHMDS